MASQAFRLSLYNWQSGYVHQRVMRKRTIGGGPLSCQDILPDRPGIAHWRLCFGDSQRSFDGTKSGTLSNGGVATQRGEDVL